MLMILAQQLLNGLNVFSSGEFASLDESSGTTTFSSLTVCFIIRFHSDVINQTGIPIKALFSLFDLDKVIWYG